MLRPAAGFALANKGVDTPTLQAYPGHRTIQHTVRYTELSPERFKDCKRLPGMAVSPSCAAAGDETLAAEIASPGLHPPVRNDNRPIWAVHDDAARLTAIDDAVRDGTLWR
jgi:hypothetical protein